MIKQIILHRTKIIYTWNKYEIPILQMYGITYCERWVRIVLIYNVLEINEVFKNKSKRNYTYFQRIQYEEWKKIRNFKIENPDNTA